MRTETRTYWASKHPDYAHEYEDAFAINADRGVVAVADGVSEAIFCRQWADILTRGIVADPPAVDSPEFWDWLARRRQEWANSIDFDNLNLFQRGKLRQVGGAYSTLLWMHWQATDEGLLDWRAYAVGDSGLFHLREGKVLQSFPFQASADLDGAPSTICSVNRQRDGLLEFRATEGQAGVGDLFVLCTDAMYGWALKLQENDAAPNWDEFWTLGPDDFQARIRAFRDERTMRTDDTTLVLVRIAPAPAGETAVTASEQVMSALAADEERPPPPASPGHEATGDLSASPEPEADLCE